MGSLLLLWDIDHTLIENHGVNKETYAAVFEMLTGRKAEHRARTDGRTEPVIMRDMLAQHGIAATPEHMAKMPGALETATLASVGALRERGHELPGARDALTAFRDAPGVVQSVLRVGDTPNDVRAGLEGGHAWWPSPPAPTARTACAPKGRISSCQTSAIRGLFWIR